MSSYLLYFSKKNATKNFNLRLIKRVFVAYYPLATKEIISGTVEFHHQCKTGYCKKSNDKAVVEKKIINANEKPMITVEFDDGRVLNWKDSSFFKVEEIVSVVKWWKEKVKEDYRQLEKDFEDSDDEDYMKDDETKDKKKKK
jgi:hypothetical protein